MESGSGSEAAAAPARPEPEAEQPSSKAAVSTAEGSSSAAPVASGSTGPLSRYESQKRRDWNTFLQYLQNHKRPLTLPRCSGTHVIEFLKYLDQFGKTKVHLTGCPYFGQPHPPASCGCPLKQAWGSLDALIGRLRAAYEENGGGRSETNPFGARAVRIYLKEVREIQAKARGIPYEKKRKRPTTAAAMTATIKEAGGSGGGSGGMSGDGPPAATRTRP